MNENVPKYGFLSVGIIILIALIAAFIKIVKNAINEGFSPSNWGLVIGSGVGSLVFIVIFTVFVIFLIQNRGSGTPWYEIHRTLPGDIKYSECTTDKYTNQKKFYDTLDQCLTENDEADCILAKPTDYVKEYDSKSACIKGSKKFPGYKCSGTLGRCESVDGVVGQSGFHVQHSDCSNNCFYDGSYIADNGVCTSISMGCDIPPGSNEGSIATGLENEGKTCWLGNACESMNAYDSTTCIQRACTSTELEDGTCVKDRSACCANCAEIEPHPDTPHIQRYDCFTNCGRGLQCPDCTQECTLTSTQIDSCVPYGSCNERECTGTKGYPPYNCDPIRCLAGDNCYTSVTACCTGGCNDAEWDYNMASGEQKNEIAERITTCNIACDKGYNLDADSGVCTQCVLSENTQVIPVIDPVTGEVALDEEGNEITKTVYDYSKCNPGPSNCRSIN